MEGWVVVILADVNVSNVGEAIVWGAGVVGGIGLLFRFAGTYILKPFARHQEEVRSEHLSAALSPLLDELGEIRAELTYNGGSSTKDAVRRIDNRLTRMEGRFEQVDRWSRHADASTPDDMEPGL